MVPSTVADVLLFSLATSRSALNTFYVAVVYVAQCDAPLQLHSSMVDAINHYASDAAFMLFTGDIVDRTFVAGVRRLPGDCLICCTDAVWLSNEEVKTILCIQ
jgi:hypothetical protein